MSVEPFKRLVKLAARAFYDDIPLKGDNQTKTGKSDDKGMAVVILDALTRRQWVREEELAKDLKLQSKQLRRTLCFFEDEKFITRYHRKETSKGAKVFNAAIAATIDAPQSGKEGDEKIKLHINSYCCLDYAQIYDVIRYRLHRMRKKLKDELDDKNKVQEYTCPNCRKRYTALDAGRLVSMEDYEFHCEACNGVLVVESEKLVAEGVEDADDNARRHKNDRLQDKLNKIEKQLKPLIEQLNRVKDLAVPEFGTLQAWEARANAAAKAAKGVFADGDPTRSSLSGTAMPYVGDTKVEVVFSEIEDKGEKIKTESTSSQLKVLPPWMIMQGMNLTTEQRGVVKEESKMEVSSVHRQSFEEKKSVGEKDEEKKLQLEDSKAYYAALLQKQWENDEAAKREQELSDFKTSNGFSLNVRQVGMKSKRDDDNDGGDVEWEEASAGNMNKSFKVVDLNVEAPASDEYEEEDEDIWEDG